MIEQLYKQQIIDLYNNPTHKSVIDNPTHHMNGNNPTCGDMIVIQAICNDQIISKIKYQGEGCAISQAALNLLIDELIGKPISVLKEYTPERIVELLGVPISVSRLNCATLGLRTCKKMF